MHKALVLSAVVLLCSSFANGAAPLFTSRRSLLQSNPSSEGSATGCFEGNATIAGVPSRSGQKCALAPSSMGRCLAQMRVQASEPAS